MVAAVSPIYNNDTFTLRNMIKEDWKIQILIVNSSISKNKSMIDTHFEIKRIRIYQIEITQIIK